MQEIITYLILGAALFYLMYRFVASKKKKGCQTCPGACSTIDFSKIDIGKTFGETKKS